MSALAIKFEVYQNGALLKEETLAQKVIKVGRMTSSHLQIDDDGVSKMHAVIEVSDSGQVHIIDLGSATGTLVNGNKVNKAVITDGDRIVLGGAEIKVSFLQAQAAAGVPAPQPMAVPPVPPISQAPPIAPPMAVGGTSLRTTLRFRASDGTASTGGDRAYGIPGAPVLADLRRPQYGGGCDATGHGSGDYVERVGFEGEAFRGRGQKTGNLLHR